MGKFSEDFAGDLREVIVTIKGSSVGMKMSRAETDVVIAQLKAELDKSGYDGNVLQFDEKLDDCCQEKILLSGVEAELMALRKNYYVDSGVRSTSPGIKRRIKKGIEKVAGLYVKPIVNDQNLYNINLLQTIEKLCNMIAQQEAEIAQLKQTIDNNDKSEEI